MSFVNHPERNVLITGLLGSNYIAIGKGLASRLKRNLLDCEAEIRRRRFLGLSGLIGLTAPSNEHEHAQQLLDSLSERRNLVVSCSAVLLAGIPRLALIQHQNYTVFIDWGFESLLQNLVPDARRGNAPTGDDRDKLFSEWQSQRELFLDADLILKGQALTAPRLSRIIAHCLTT